MDNSDAPKARRPLPTPGVAPNPPRPSTPIQRPLQRAPIEPSSFYGTTTTSASLKAAPPLPARSRMPSNLSTSHTATVDPPRYDHSPAGYREPELIVDEEPMDDTMPDLISQDTDSNGWTKSSWNTGWEETAPASSTYDMMDMFASKHDSDLPIDGRIDREELNWWNEEERKKGGRPGPGLLPPMLAEELHNPNHRLYSLHIVGTPDFTPQNPPTSARLDQTPSSTYGSSSPQPPHSATPLTNSPSLGQPPFIPPTEEEVRTAIPHPNAYYCPKENGWVILSWKSSNMTPPTAESFVSSLPFPEQYRRRRTSNCITSHSRTYGNGNKTHHFHQYRRAVDSLQLSPPYAEDSWMSHDSAKHKNRSKTVVNDIDRLRSEVVEESRESTSRKKQKSGIMLDLYMCCQCGLYCTVSPLIPGVVPRKYMDELLRDKRNNPPPGKTGEVSVANGVDTLLM